MSNQKTHNNIDPDPENTFSSDTEGTAEENQHLPVMQQLVVLAVIMLLIFGTGIVTRTLEMFDSNSNAETAHTVTAVAHDTNTQSAEPTADPFTNLAITAESAFVWDVQAQKALYQKNPDEQLPLASITKLMTALVAHELVTDQTAISIDEAAIGQDGNSGFLKGESFSLGDLLDLTLLSSSNDGAFAIATTIGAELAPSGGAGAFVEAMNIRAEELGLTQTYFRNPTGLDISKSDGGAYGSARDVTFLMEHILSEYPEIIAATTQTDARITSDTGARHDVDNTNPLVAEIPGLIGSKTGYTDLAGGNLAIAFDAGLNRPIIVVVLGSTHSGRFEDVLTLANSARISTQAK